MPKVSVLLCSNSNNDFFYEAVDSILQQKYTGFELELIIVLNGGAKSCYDEIRSKICDDRVFIFSSEINQLLFNLNFGLNFCRGEFVARMDADDLALPTRLQTQYDYLHAHPNVSVVGSAALIIDSLGCVRGNIQCLIEHDDIANKFAWSNPLIHPSVMYKKSAVLSVGGYLNGKKSEDYDLWGRMLDAGFVFSNIQEPLLKYRIHEQQAKGDPMAYAEIASFHLKRFLINKKIHSFFIMFLWIAKFFFSGFRNG